MFSSVLNIFFSKYNLWNFKRGHKHVTQLSVKGWLGWKGQRMPGCQEWCGGFGCWHWKLSLAYAHTLPSEANLHAEANIHCRQTKGYAHRAHISLLFLVVRRLCSPCSICWHICVVAVAAVAVVLGCGMTLASWGSSIRPSVCPSASLTRCLSS